MMKLLIIFSFILWFSECLNLPMDDDVYIVTDTNYGALYNHTKENEGALLLYFYDKDTDRRKDFYREYKKAAKIFTKNKEKIYLAKVNRKNYRISSFFKIRETPRVVVVSSNEKMLHRYYEEEEKTADDIVFWARRIIPPGSKVFNTRKEFETIFNKGHHLVTGFFSKEDSKDWKAFIKAGVILRYVNFAYTLNLTLISELGLQNTTNSVTIFYKQEMMNHTETKFLLKTNSSESIYQFVVREYVLPIDVYDKYSDLYYDSDKMITMLCFEKIDLLGENRDLSFYRTELSGLYEELIGKTQLALWSEEEMRHLPYLLDTYREVELVARKDQKWYKSLSPVASPLDPFNFTLVKEFVDNVYYGRIDPFVRSQEPFEKNNTNGIINLVGRNFVEFTNQTGHEYILMFYAPWNSRWKMVRNELEKLANGPLKDIQNLHIVQMDSDKNFVPEQYQVGEMPTIYFLKDKVRKRPMIYKSGYSGSALLKFLEMYSDLYQAHLSTPEKEDL